MVNETIKVRVEKSQGRFERIRNPQGPDGAIGKFFLLLTVTALTETVYLPISIASGKKPTGFVYQIEGTGEATITTTDIAVRGDGVTQVRLGTLVFAKIPPTMTAEFRIQIVMKGKIGKAYKIILGRLNYKLDPAAARYQTITSTVATKFLQFK